MSADDLQREKEETPADEKTLLKREVYGKPDEEEMMTTSESAPLPLSNGSNENRKPQKESSDGITMDNSSIERTAQDLERFQNELDRMVAAKREDTSAYERALQACPAIVSNPDFRLSFLRADKFNPEKAASRMVKYWQFKIRLFGEKVALRPNPIGLDDLSPDDLASLDKDGIQLLPHPDRTGRRIILTTRRNFVFEDRENVGRLIWYLFHVAMEDTTDGGVVLIMFDDGPFRLNKDYDRKLDKLMFDLVIQALPLRVLSIHHCQDNPIIEMILPMFWFMMGQDWRRRYHMYPGSKRKERLPTLEGFGIKSALLPHRMGGTLIDFDIEQWKEDRRTKEGQLKQETSVDDESPIKKQPSTS